ncbi:lecithin retinol acyltransferase family protein [endosymbiont GvMRE of Glomus versiforme]|uniref:lecithin retinol acyltransferase family protein n=2 Tax=endosymbiont GvMRE of Glomus versiforme TaxID=2039283 RepID=UPI0011C40849|nr:lecithin retinol acyltransferase family protein [endosymbiont GvMRE of Glomus versiforme]
MTNNWYCKNCKEYKDSWAEHQNYESDKTYRRDIKCYSCDKHSLIYTDSQKSRYKDLAKQRTSILGRVEEVEIFSTWWSNNIATTIVYHGSRYWVYLLVYDPVYNTSRPVVFPTSSDCAYWGDSSRGRKGHNYLSDARSEANWLRDELASSYGKYRDNPMLLIHPYCDCYKSFNSFVTEPYVKKKYSTSYLKPFDVVKTDMTMFDHVGVYLGKIDGESKVCQYTRERQNTTIDNWSSFLEGKVTAYHPIIPFKNYKDIAKQIVWAKDNDYRKNNYDLHRRNCEHFANMLVYGINYSGQIEQKKKNAYGLS